MSIIGNPILTGGLTPKLIEKEIDRNGLFSAAAEGADGFFSVRVRVEGGGSSTAKGAISVHGETGTEFTLEKDGIILGGEIQNARALVLLPEYGDWTLRYGTAHSILIHVDEDDCVSVGLYYYLYANGTAFITFNSYRTVYFRESYIEYGIGGGSFTNNIRSNDLIDLSGFSKIVVVYTSGTDGASNRAAEFDISSLNSSYYISQGYLTDSNHNEGFISMIDTYNVETKFRLWTTSGASRSPYYVHEIYLY